jgi:hypothetical protein
VGQTLVTENLAHVWSGGELRSVHGPSPSWLPCLCSTAGGF